MLQSVTDDDGSVTETVIDVTNERIVWMDGLPRFARTMRQHEPDPVDWTPDLVRERLEEAIKLVQRSAGRVGPAGYGSTMPDYMPEWGDLLIQVDAGNIHDDGNRIRLGATAAQVSAMERALRWPIEYLLPYDQPRKLLLSWMNCRAQRRPWSVHLKRQGIALATAKRQRSRALGLIAIGLTMDGVKP